MIYHVIRLSVRDDAPEEEVAAALEAMRSSGTQIASARSALFGRDVGGEFDYAAVSSYETLEEYEAMMNHPAHLEVDRLGLSLIEQFVSFDITDDPDPEIEARIADIHRRRFTANQDISELVSGIDSYSGSAAPLAEHP